MPSLPKYEKLIDVINTEDSVESGDGDALLSGTPQKSIRASKFKSAAFRLVLLVSLVCNTIFIFHVTSYRQREYNGVDQKSPLTEFGMPIIR